MKWTISKDSRNWRKHQSHVKPWGKLGENIPISIPIPPITKINWERNMFQNIN